MLVLKCRCSQGEEKEGEPDGGEDSDEEDDGFFVPHGYLSNDEGDCSDSGEGIPGPDDDVSILREEGVSQVM